MAVICGDDSTSSPQSGSQDKERITEDSNANGCHHGTITGGLHFKTVVFDAWYFPSVLYDFWRERKDSVSEAKSNWKIFVDGESC